MEEKIIEHKNKVLKTTKYKEITEQEYLEIIEEFYKKPNKELVKKQFKALSKGGVQNNHITNYYFKDLMAKTKIYFNKWSIEEVLECKQLVEFFMGKANDNKKVFPDTMSNCKKIETAFRLCGKGVASKPSNFPIKTVDNILEQYNINDNYYDFSCGWGARLTSALKNNINYFGTDPNYLLTERLEELSKYYKSTVGTNTKVDIRMQGSEVFIPEWENTIGLAFSSPPYFYLEDYKIGEQSYKEGTTYNEWKENYLKPTVRNIYLYLINEGYFCLNINNFEKYNLVEDSIEIAKEYGFKLIAEHELNNIKRCYGNQSDLGKAEFNNNNERILVFIKE